MNTQETDDSTRAPRLSADSIVRDGLVWNWRVRYQDFAVRWLESGFMAAHWRESGTFNDELTLDIDHRYYQGLEMAGLLDILVVEDEGEMIAYMIMIKQRYPRSRHASVGTVDMMYVDPEYRATNLGGGLGWQMMKAAVEFLRSSGINLAFFREKADHKGGHLRRLGFEKLSTTWGLVLNAPGRKA